MCRSSPAISLKSFFKGNWEGKQSDFHWYLFVGTAFTFLLLTLPVTEKSWAQVAKSSTDVPMYFHSYRQDSADCAIEPNESGTLSFRQPVSNPAATCPDAYAWLLYLDAIKNNFWTDWANDETVWVSNPKPLCSNNVKADCCFVSQERKPKVGYIDSSGQVREPQNIGGPGEHCPYIPGDWGGARETTFSGGKPVTNHNTTFLRTIDVGRIARQREVEVVYRNDSFVKYTTVRDIYSKEGLKRLFAGISGQAAHSAPYRPMGQGVAYPADAIMFKVDWIPEATMQELGYSPSEGEFITMKINVSTDQGKDYEEGLYYLASITGASKALPNWHWFAFEHVNNPGRCDYTGCNDSFGYSTEITTYAPIQTGDTPTDTITFDSNFIPAKIQDDQLADGTDLFDRNKTYPSGTISKNLEALFNFTGVATGGSANPEMPSASDPAWRNYRLKGTQTQYYNNDGYETIVGASITEGGFVNTASCLSCHVQASVDANANPGTSVGASGRLNLFGLGKVVNGAPYIGDYYRRGTADQVAVQTDFVWGILFAK